MNQKVTHFLPFTCDSMPLCHWRASLATTLRSAGSALHSHCLALMVCWDMNWEPSTLRRPNKGCSNASGSEHSTMSLRPWNSADAAATSSSDICAGSSQTVRRPSLGRIHRDWYENRLQATEKNYKMWALKFSQWKLWHSSVWLCCLA